MVGTPGTRGSRFLVGVMLGAALGLIAIAIWMIVKDEGSPVFVAVAGSFLAAFAAILASQSGKTKA
jgi:biotin transporter BioY